MTTKERSDLITELLALQAALNEEYDDRIEEILKLIEEEQKER